ncbi:MAG: TonB-dependent receptor plug domain-containing protein, partial [Myxococcota bacterium]
MHGCLAALSLALGAPGPTSTATVSLPAQGPEVITVHGASARQNRELSAEAVTVVGLEDARSRAADLGEILARTQGVAVRRSGGLGADTSFALNGLTNERIRFFVDGIPLELMGYPMGLANVPVHLVRRVDIYRGVVPIRYGADALGGAIDLVTDDGYLEPSTELSYQVGSWGTHRGAATTGFAIDEVGFVARLEGFADLARNNYDIDVEIADARGRINEVEVERFHDDYQALGGTLTLGLVEQEWADKLLVRAFVTDNERDLQHNVVMTVPYGEVRSHDFAAGGMLRYAIERSTWSLRLDGGYTYQATELFDLSTCIYDWNGRCTAQRRVPGEIDPRPRDQIQKDHTLFIRAAASWTPLPNHTFSLSLAPTLASRSGNDRLLSDPKVRDPQSAQRELLTTVAGIDYDARLWDGRLSSITFAKAYYQTARSEEPLPGNVFVERDRDTERFGLGTSLRFEILPGLATKASYEWAARLPRAEEVFGNAVLVGPNLELRPEESHNVNLGAQVLLVPDESETPQERELVAVVDEVR